MGEPFKETLFSPKLVGELADHIKTVYTTFDQNLFIERVFGPSWPQLELMERMRHITLILRDMLPPDYRQALDILTRTAGLYHEQAFLTLVFDDYVSMFGLDDWEASLPALALFTGLCSAEFAVRPFIVKDQARMLAQMLVWANSDNPQHRRLASEGSRTRLPWGISLPALKKDPRPLLPILEKLKNDPEEMVRRSVANNLNDITKDNPQTVIDLLTRWKAEGIPSFSEIANRALRSMIKKGDPAALNLVGIQHGSAVTVANLKVEPESIPMGGEVSFSFDLVSTGEETQKLVVDYVLYMQRANNKQTAKVFKCCKKEISAGQTLTISRRHSFAEVTTRRYYPGRHAIEIQINGVAGGRVEFEVTAGG